MKNLIKYYYDLEIDSIVYSFGEYKFKYKSFDYCLVSIEREINEINDIYNLCAYLHRLNIPCHEIIPNNLNSLITDVSQRKYVLLKKYVTSNQLITVDDIIYFNLNTTYNWNFDSLKRTSWDELWTRKIDYYEYQIGQIGKQYPMLYNTLCYFTGLTESGLQLIKMTESSGNLSVCHKRIYKNMTLTEFYNPLNFVIDYRIRDISEYYKQNIFNLSDYLYSKLYYTINTYFDQNDVLLLFIRFFLPTFYFDLYEEIIGGNEKEEKILEIIENIKMYETFLKKIYVYIKTYIRIPRIEWLE